MPTTISFYQKTSYYLSDTASKQSQVRKRMATAYAAFTSLMHLTTQLHQHPHPPIQLDEKQFDSLSSKICFFQRFLEDHHSTIDHESEIRIADAAHAAEDLIETHIADRVPDFCGSLKRVIEHIDLIKKEMMVGMNRNEQSQQGTDRPARNPVPDASSQSSLAASGENEQSQQGSDRPARYPMPDASQPPLAASSENFTVGIEDITIDVVDKLTSKSDRQIISISGMGGIGKTTLARTVYEHSYTKYYFDCFAWATISKDYNTQESLLEILHCLDKSKSKESLTKKSEYELGIQMYQYLSGRRYLVILDDIWDFEAWDRMRSFFPACRGSGIVVTSRESKFASISSHSFRVDFLDERKSWDLFCKHAFGQGRCPDDELWSVGKEIAMKCRGLPLSIAVIGRHLAKSPGKPEYWKNIANDMSSVDDDHCLKIVSLSYAHLPVHLKPCFLYFAIFPEDKKIKVSRLIRLWVVEGFVKPIKGKSLEDAARDYLNDLVDRNLILDFQSSRRGRMKRCKIHDLLRDFCLKEASNKNFICTVQKLDDLKVTNNERRIVVPQSSFKEAAATDLLSKKQELSDNIEMQNSKISGLNDPIANHLDVSIALLRSLIFGGILRSIENKLVRVLVPYDEYFGEGGISHTQVPEILHKLVNARYIELARDNRSQVYILPSSISLLWNLQYLIVRDYNIKAPPEIWKMPYLRHIEFYDVILPHPPSEESSSDVVMKNLQSARTMINFSFCEEVVRRIPNIKKLKVCYDHGSDGFEEGVRTLNNVDRLQKLESFECFGGLENTERHMFRNLTFPRSLKRLEVGCLCWDDVTTKIGSLPLLEVLVLDHCTGCEWKLVEGKFVKLKYLHLHWCCSLQYWTPNNNHFPCLQRLLLVSLDSLEGISSEIGDITALESIELWSCPDSTVISAKEIADEQYDLGNPDLQVTAMFRKDESGLLRSIISTRNFHIELFD